MKPKRIIVASLITLGSSFSVAANYTVQAGETLYRISAKLGFSTDLIKQLNNLTDTNLKAGQVLLIPDKHTVVKGETLFQIAKKYNTNIDAIRKFNNFSNDALRLGQVVLIPPIQVSLQVTQPKAVQTGGTQTQAPQVPAPLSTTKEPAPKEVPSQNTQTEQPKTTKPVTETASQVLPVNLPQLSAPIVVKNLEAPLPIFMGTNVSPVGLGPTGVAQPENTNPLAAPSAVTETTEQWHIVASGENLFRIAAKYSVSVEAIRAVNKLETDALAVGQKLKIPADAVNTASSSNIQAINPTSDNQNANIANVNSTSTNSANTNTRLRDVARKYLGVPYVWGGATKNGLDCSGFVMVVYNELGVQLPHSSKMLFAMGQAITRENLREGDLVFFDTTGEGVSHVGMYLQDGQFIHAATYPSEVTVSRLDEKYWAPKYLGARRIKDLQ